MIRGAGCLVSACVAFMMSCSSVAQQTKPEAKAATTRLVAVMPLSRVGGVEGDNVTAFEETVRTLAGDALREQGFIVLTSDTTLRLLQENGIDAASVCDANCALSAAKEMKSELFVAGTISKTEGRLLALLRLFDVQGKQLSSLTMEGESFRELRDTLRLQANRLFYPLSGKAGTEPVVERSPRQTGGVRTVKCEQLEFGSKPFVAMHARRADDLWLATGDGEVYRFDGVELRLAHRLNEPVTALVVTGRDSAFIQTETTLVSATGKLPGEVPRQLSGVIRSEEVRALWWDCQKLWAGGASTPPKQKQYPTVWRRESDLFGEKWQAQHSDARKAGARFTSLHGSGSIFYAVGERVARRREGDQWADVRGLADDAYNAVWVNAANDVWIAGREWLQHWDGARWASAPLGAESVACTEPKMCFATSGGKPYGWSGSEWVPIQMDGDATVAKVFVLGSDRVWFVGGREGQEGTVLSCRTM
jgi:hypothetical protein